MMRFLLALIAAGALAQNAPHIRDWRPEASERPKGPVTSCTALQSLTGYEYSVMTTELLEATAAAPAFCRVLIQVQPEIRIEVSLPSLWNGRLYMFGNGGYAGESLHAPGRVAHRDAALRAGFTVTQTNTGHDAEKEPLASFALNPQKTLDYAFRSLHVTAMTAKTVAAAYYGSRPRRSYYNGCSTGGRQALIFAQRYPEDFDGIISGAPALDLIAARFRSIASTLALASAPVPMSKVKLLADRVYARCDAADGLKDGLITDPRRCDFRPSRDLPVCPAGEAAECFTPAQVRSLETVYSKVVVNGRTMAREVPPGAEAAGPNGVSGWNNWIIREGQLPQGALFAESALRYMVFSKPDPDYQLSQFNLSRDEHIFDGVGKLLNATDPDLSRFRNRGGKLLMYSGWADPAVNPYIALEYYQSVVKRMGALTSDFFRLYMLPGVFHCSGGVGPACFDPLMSMVPWVEMGKAPEAIKVSQMQEGKAIRTRLICPEPQVAQYRGQGSPDEAASFHCATAPAR